MKIKCQSQGYAEGVLSRFGAAAPELWGGRALLRSGVGKEFRTSRYDPVEALPFRLPTWDRRPLKSNETCNRRRARAGAEIANRTPRCRFRPAPFGRAASSVIQNFDRLLHRLADFGLAEGHDLRAGNGHRPDGFGVRAVWRAHREPLVRQAAHLAGSRWGWPVKR
jgi:hypothetical protein